MKTKLKKLSKSTVSILLTLTLLVLMAVVGLVSTSALDFTSGKTIYFDNSWTNWSSVYLRVGTTSNNSAYLMTKVSGTDNIYSYTIPGLNGYEAFAIANNCSWTGSNSIYKVNTGDDYDITASTDYLNFSVTSDIFIVPKSVNNTSDGCTYYHVCGVGNSTASTTAQSTFTTLNKSVSVSSTNGTVTATYTTGNGGTITSGNSANVLYGSTLTLTNSANNGYGFDNYTLANMDNTATNTTSSATKCVVGNRNNTTQASSITGNFSLRENLFNVTSSANANGSVSPSSASAGPVYTTAEFTATPNTGYVFSNWTLSSSVSAATGYSTSNNPIKVNASADGTITANFTEKPTKTIHVDVDQHVQVTVSGSSVSGQNQTFTEDGTFTAHVGDVIEFSAAGQTSEYTYDVLKYTYGSTDYTDTSFTVQSAGGDYTITATSKKKSGYYFYVNAGTGAKATVTISGQSTTVNAGTRQKFTVDDEGTSFTISASVTNSSTYESPTITKIVNAVNEAGTAVASGSAQTGQDANGATYFVTASEKMTAASGVYLLTSTSNNVTSLADSGLTVYEKNSHKYIIIPSNKLNGTNQQYFGLSGSNASNTGYQSMYDQQENNDPSFSVIVDSASTDYIEAGKTLFNGQHDDYRDKHYGFSNVKLKPGVSVSNILLDYYNHTYTYSVYSGGSVTAFDTYYLGGRFRIKDGDTNQFVYTDTDEGSWQTYSIRMPFTKVGNTNEYTLNTNQTIAQLSAQLDGRPPYFIVHDKKNAFHTNGNSEGLNFEDQKDSANALTLTEDGNLTYENELMFSDAESNSDGIVTIHFDSSTKKIWYTVENETAPVASSVQLDVKYNGTAVTNTTAGNTVTLTATVTSPHANAESMTYTFFNETTDQQIGEPVTTNATTVNATVSYTENHVRTDTFKVVVSSAVTDSSTGKTLRDIWDRQDVQFTNPNLYRTDVDLAGSTQKLVNDGNWNTTAIPDSTDHTFTLSLDQHEKYEFAIATKVPVGEADYTTLENNRTSDFYIDEKLTKYCDISYTTLTVSYNNGEDTEMYTVRTYTVVPRTNCTNPTVHINTNAVAVKDANGDTVYYPGSIYAIANYAPGKTNTKESTEKVTYYFAEATDQTGKSLTGDGVRIAYWNNSLDAGNLSAATIKANATKVDVTTAVNVSGSNQIYVDMNKLYSAGDTTDGKTFNVYSVELPIWATSFTFLDTNDNPISTRSIKKEWGEYAYGSLLLNPNRVYLLYKDQSFNSYYTKGVVLDKGLWNNTIKNDVGTKTFKSNAINFNTTYGGDSVNNGFNDWLSARVYNNFQNGKALYFGYTTDVSGYNAGTLANNLAMRQLEQSGQENDYFASIQDLVAEKLDTDNVNSNGFPLLEAYTDTAKHNKVNMPLFDYEALAQDKSSQSNPLIDREYTGVNFPMYESVFNGITTYSFDSSTDRNRTISNGDFVIDNEWRIARDDLGYKPFIGDSTCTADKNYGNATELDVEFFMSNTGSLKDSNGKNHDITFNFTGDDDVWVYVDGVLILDLGGAHKASAATINFTDMMVYYKTAADSSDNTHDVYNDTWPHTSGYINTINLQALFEANGNNFNNKDGNTKHTFQMFYMERGAIDSNMSVSFNLPQASGLNINNQVTANNVNMGLKEAALYAANSDYFTFGVQAALDDSGSLYGNTTAVYPGAAKNPAATAAITAEQGPVYPMDTNTDRAFSTTVALDGQYQTLSATYPLSRSNAGSTEGARYNQTTSFTGLSGVTYSLSDKYLKEADGHTSGNLEVSGKTNDSGEFNLLGGQTATFEDKVTPHSFVKVYQKSDLGKVNTGVTPIGYSTVNENYTNNYYVTSYSIYDDHSSTWIKPKTEPIVSTGANNNFYVADNSANSNMFYFSDYGKLANSAAMTVTFYNDIAVGDIRISKDYNGDANTTFYYDLKFANIFGSDDTNLTTLVEYNHITYDVVDTATGALVARDRAYGNTGIALKKGQTAVISGVPVETIYRVTERSKSGTMLNAINKYVKGPDGAALADPIPQHGYAESFNSLQITDQSIRGTSDVYQEINGDKYYINMIPIIEESYKNGAYKTTSYVKFENQKTSIKVRFHYYDRSLQNGKPANINETATIYTVNTSLSDDLMSVTNNNAAIRAALKDMIEGAAVEFIDQALTQNVVDDYVMWSSLAAATDANNGIGAQTNIKTLERYDQESNYESAKAYHTNSLSQLLPSSNYTDLNKWVSYKVGESFPDAESYVNGEDALKITEVNVWLFNTPHEYTVNIYGAKSTGDLSAPTTANVGGKTMSICVASSTNSTSTMTNQKVYYNQRLGMALNDDYADTTTYIHHYDRPAFREDIEPVDYLTRDTLTNGGKNYRFAYWAYDPAGQIVASRDAYYYYRVTKDLDLYAVYAETQLQEKVDVGLTIFNNRNDVYVDTSGVSRTRMNVVINPYALEDSDSSLQQTALVYVNLSKIVSSWDNTDIMALFNQYKDQLVEILTAKAANAFNSVNNISFLNPASISINGQNVTEVTLTTRGFVRNAFRTDNVFTQTEPTSKNRVQYTLSIKTATLKADTKLMFVGAMYYNGNYESGVSHWKTSDNCLIYENGNCKALDFGRVNS